MCSFLRGQRGCEASEGRTGLNVDVEGTRAVGRGAGCDGLVGDAMREGVRGKPRGLEVPFLGLGEAAPACVRETVRVFHV